jgi:hypothetical protein
VRAGLFLALAGLGLLPSLLRVAGCAGDDSNAEDGGEASSGVEDPYDEGPNYCDLDAFFRVDGSGGACSPIAPDNLCFVECEGGGGCSCVVGPKGTGVWQCHVDRSCIPKCPPEDLDCALEGSTFFDTGPTPDVVEEPLSDGMSDAGSGDGGTQDGSQGDGPHEAAADAPRPQLDL